MKTIKGSWSRIADRKKYRDNYSDIFNAAKLTFKGTTCIIEKPNASLEVLAMACGWKVKVANKKRAKTNSHADH